MSGGPAEGFGRWVRELPELLKLELSLLALPFSLAGMFLAARGVPSWDVILLVVGATIVARTAGMSFNRVLDRKYDAANPRTVDRAVAAGRIGVFGVWALGFLCLGLLSLFAGLLNPLCFKLSFLCHFLLIGYSLTKRFTWLCHFVLGLVEAFAPIGGWVAVTGSLSHPAPWLLGAATVLWIAGLDLAYATLDVDFDRKSRLHSFPARFGTSAGFLFAKLCHALTVLLTVLAGWTVSTGFFFYAGTLAMALLFYRQHKLADASGGDKISASFFAANTQVSLALLAGVLLDSLADICFSS